MAEEKKENQANEKEPKKGKKFIFVIIIAAVVLIGAGAGGFFFLKKGGEHKAEESIAKKEEVEVPKEKEKPLLIQLDPFILNLSEPGRFVKLTIHLEVKNEKVQQYVNDRMPKIRDTVITLVSSKSPDILATPEGKLQLKDELLLRINQALEKEFVKNLYFTEFVIQ